MTNREWILEAEFVDETTCLRCDEFCARLAVEQHWISELVEIGALEPRSGFEPATWSFAIGDLPRARMMTRLVEELEVNLPGAAIIVELIEERRQLVKRLRQLAASTTSLETNPSKDRCTQQ
jgi:chaperone modulatory protein CbpM